MARTKLVVSGSKEDATPVMSEAERNLAVERLLELEIRGLRAKARREQEKFEAFTESIESFRYWQRKYITKVNKSITFLQFSLGADKLTIEDGDTEEDLVIKKLIKSAKKYLGKSELANKFIRDDIWVADPRLKDQNELNKDYCQRFIEKRIDGVHSRPKREHEEAKETESKRCSKIVRRGRYRRPLPYPEGWGKGEKVLSTTDDGSSDGEQAPMDEEEEKTQTEEEVQSTPTSKGYDSHGI